MDQVRKTLEHLLELQELLCKRFVKITPRKGVTGIVLEEREGSDP